MSANNLLVSSPSSENGGTCLERAILLVVVVLSGAAALVYEVSWARQVGLAMGHTAQATAVVLAGYFTGLAVGQVIGSGFAGRINPLLGYGVAEIATGGLAALVPLFLTWAGRAGDGWEGIVCFASLLPATVALGTTFPLVAEHFSLGRPRTTLLYALNTAGGIFGVIAAAAVLLAVVGVQGSGYAAAVVSVGCGLIACRLALGSRVHLRPSSPALSSGGVSWDWRLVAAVSGFGTLGLEVLYTRLFALVFHNSTYTFSAVLAVFLAGLALGAGLVSKILRWVSPRRVAAFACLIGGLLVPASVVLFARLTHFQYFAAGDTFASYLVGVFGVIACVVLPPVVILGTAFPAAFVAAGQSGKAVGRLAAINTASAVFGALAAGFLLPGWLGLWGAFAVLSAISCAVGLVLLAPRSRWLTVGGAGIGSIGLVGAFLLYLPGAGTSGSDSNEEVVRRWESSHGLIDVVRARSDGTLRVRQNLHYRHGSTANAVREYRQGRLPLLLHHRPADVAFLGIGTGLTAAPVIRDRDVQHAVLVELVPEVVDAARLLGAANLGVVDHPKVTVVVDDARHFVSRDTRGFDVIVSDLFVPWESRTGYLYTTDFYTAVRRRLNPGGHFCQWLALYQLGSGEFEMIANSFAAVFPNTTLWWGQFDARYAMVAIIGSDTPLNLNEDMLASRFAAVGAMSGGADPDLGWPGDLPTLFLGRWPSRAGRELNTDEHPRIEFRAPISHGSNSTLSGPRLRDYFDTVLARLPSDGVKFEGVFRASTLNSRQRRSGQRLSLFGDGAADGIAPP